MYVSYDLKDYEFKNLRYAVFPASEDKSTKLWGFEQKKAERNSARSFT
jgi:hypothetical protein